MQWGTWGKLIVIAVIFVVGHLLASDFLQPKLIGSRVHLHQVWVIFALLAFGELFGFLGVLLALPAAAVTGVLVRFALARYRQSSLYDPGRADISG
jgi:predicted PurR-regulated permease PerM